MLYFKAGDIVETEDGDRLFVLHDALEENKVFSCPVMLLINGRRTLLFYTASSTNIKKIA